MGKGDVEAQLDHAFQVIRVTFGSGIGGGRRLAPAAAPAPTATVSTAA